MTTLIPAIVLAYFGTGPLRGFAVTLVLGIVANLFAALVVTRNTYDWILTATETPYLKMAQFIKSPKYDFLKYKGVGLILSLIIIGLGAATVAMKGDALLGVDFKGGDALTMTYTQPVEIGQLRNAITKADLKDVLLQAVSGTNAGKYALQVETEEGQGEKAAQALETAFPQVGFIARIDEQDRRAGRRGDEAKGADRAGARPPRYFCSTRRFASSGPTPSRRPSDSCMTC